MYIRSNYMEYSWKNNSMEVGRYLHMNIVIKKKKVEIASTCSISHWNEKEHSWHNLCTSQKQLNNQTVSWAIDKWSEKVISSVCCTMQPLNSQPHASSAPTEIQGPTAKLESFYKKTISIPYSHKIFTLHHLLSANN